MTAGWFMFHMPPTVSGSGNHVDRGVKKLLSSMRPFVIIAASRRKECKGVVVGLRADVTYLIATDEQ